MQYWWEVATGVAPEGMTALELLKVRRVLGRVASLLSLSDSRVISGS